MEKALKATLVVFGILVVSNLLALDFFWFTGKNFTKSNLAANTEVSEPKTIQDSCGSICQETVTEKIKEELAKITPLAGQSSLIIPTSKPVAQPTANGKKVLYIPLVTEGKTVLTAWTDIVPSDFYFDLTNYSGAKEVRFETYLLAVNGSAKVYARLYDVTNKRGVDYSELYTANDTFTRLESGGISIWRGNNKYTVQLRSENGTEVQLKEAKLKIIF